MDPWARVTCAKNPPEEVQGLRYVTIGDEYVTMIELDQFLREYFVTEAEDALPQVTTSFAALLVGFFRALKRSDIASCESVVRTFRKVAQEPGCEILDAFASFLAHRHMHTSDRDEPGNDIDLTATYESSWQVCKPENAKQCEIADIDTWWRLIETRTKLHLLARTRRYWTRLLRQENVPEGVQDLHYEELNLTAREHAVTMPGWETEELVPFIPLLEAGHEFWIQLPPDPTHNALAAAFSRFHPAALGLLDDRFGHVFKPFFHRVRASIPYDDFHSVINIRFLDKDADIEQRPVTSYIHHVLYWTAYMSPEMFPIEDDTGIAAPENCCLTFLAYMTFNTALQRECSTRAEALIRTIFRYTNLENATSYHYHHYVRACPANSREDRRTFHETFFCKRCGRGTILAPLRGHFTSEEMAAVETVLDMIMWGERSGCNRGMEPWLAPGQFAFWYRDRQRRPWDHVGFPSSERSARPFYWDRDLFTSYGIDMFYDDPKWKYASQVLRMFVDVVYDGRPIQLADRTIAPSMQAIFGQLTLSNLAICVQWHYDAPGDHFIQHGPDMGELTVYKYKGQHSGPYAAFFGKLFGMFQTVLSTDDPIRYFLWSKATKKVCGEFYTRLFYCHRQPNDVEGQVVMYAPVIADDCVKRVFGMDRDEIFQGRGETVFIPKNTVAKRVCEALAPAYGIEEPRAMGEDYIFVHKVLLDLLQKNLRKCLERAHELGPEFDNIEEAFIMLRREAENNFKYVETVHERVLEARDRGNEYGQQECVVCFEECERVAFLPCGHLACCNECATMLINQPCPICRTVVTRHVVIRYA